MLKLLFVAIFISCLSFGVVAQENKQACPSISVAGPTSIVFYGNNAVFSANLDARDVSNINGANITYQWAVSEGEIVNGQGTSSISVRVPSESTNNNLRTTVTITGLPRGCVSEAKEVTPLSPACALPAQADEYGRQPFKDEKARLANVAIQLNANPGFSALFLIYVTPNGSNSFITKRVTNIKNYLAKRFGIAETRLRFVFAKQDSYLTKIYLIPPGAIDDFLGLQSDPKTQ